MAEDIVNRLILKADQFFSTMNQAADRTERFQRDAQRGYQALSGKIQSIGRVLSTVFVSGVLARVINKQVELGDRLDKTSRSLGIQAQELSNLNFAAERAGVSQEELSRGFAQAQKNLLDFTRGTGEARRELEAVGLTQAQAAELLKNPTEAFLTVGDAVNRSTNKTAASMKLLGESGKKLIPFFQGGREELQKLFDLNQKMNPNVNEQARLSAELKDRMADLTVAWEGFLNRGLLPVLPTLTQIVKLMTELVALDTDSLGFRLNTVGQDLFTSLQLVRDLLADPLNYAETLKKYEALDKQFMEERKRRFGGDAQAATPVDSLPVVTVAAKSQAAETESVLKLREAELKLIEAEDERAGIVRDRAFDLKGEIILLKESLAIQKEIEAAAKGNREIDPFVESTASVERLAAMVKLAQERKKHQDDLNAAIQTELGLDAQSEAAQQLILRARDLNRIAQEEEFNLQLRQIDTLGDESLLRGQQVISLQAKLNAEKNLLEVMGRTEERVKRIQVLEAQLANIKRVTAAEEQRAAGLAIVEQSKRDLQARLEPARRAVRDAQKEVEFGNRAPGQLPETNRLRRIELIQKTIDLLEEEHRVGLISTEEFNRGFILADADLRRETYESQRGFLEGWQDAFKQFSEDSAGAFGLAQTLARNFVSSLQSFATNAAGTAIDAMTDKTIRFRDVLQTIPDLLKQIASQLIGMAVAQGVASAIGGGLGGLFGGGVSPTLPGPSTAGANFFNPLPKFAHGGSFVVGGPGGTDQTPVKFWATRGETVTVETPSQRQRGMEGMIVNVFNNNSSAVKTEQSPDNKSLNIYIDKRIEQSLARGQGKKIIARDFGKPIPGRVG